MSPSSCKVCTNQLHGPELLFATVSLNGHPVIYGLPFENNHTSHHTSPSPYRKLVFRTPSVISVSHITLVFCCDVASQEVRPVVAVVSDSDQ